VGKFRKEKNLPKQIFSQSQQKFNTFLKEKKFYRPPANKYSALLYSDQLSNFWPWIFQPN